MKNPPRMEECESKGACGEGIKRNLSIKFREETIVIFIIGNVHIQILPDLFRDQVCNIEYIYHNHH